MLALVGQPSLHSNDACTVCWADGASRRNCRQRDRDTSFSNKGFSVQSEFQGTVLGSHPRAFVDWEGQASGASSTACHVAVEVFNVGSWLTHGDSAVEAGVDSLLLLLNID